MAELVFLPKRVSCSGELNIHANGSLNGRNVSPYGIQPVRYKYKFTNGVIDGAVIG